ncbi:MAG: hypothetical protein ACFNZS_06800 [Ottowia sp.]
MPKEYGEYDFVWLAAAYVAASVVEHGAMLAFTFAPAFKGGRIKAAKKRRPFHTSLCSCICAAWPVRPGF